MSVTLVPLTVAAKLVGAPGAAPHGVAPTVKVASLDGPLTPLAFTARTRTKYVPDETPVAENSALLLPVEKFARLLSPDIEPTSIEYDPIGQPPDGACHVRVRLPPDTIA